MLKPVSKMKHIKIKSLIWIDSEGFRYKSWLSLTFHDKIQGVTVE